MSVRRDRFRFTDTEKTIVSKPKMTMDFAEATKAAEIEISIVLQLLRIEHQDNILYDKVWREAKKKYEKKKRILLNQSRQQIPEECRVAIIAYTLDTTVNVKGVPLKLYQDFNKECRSLAEHHSWNRFPYKSFYCLLLRALPGVRSNPSTENVIYRGANFRYGKDDIIPDDFRLFNFTQFQSFSSDVKVAEAFAGDRGTLMVFHYTAMAACGIVDYSDFPGEQEVLVFPWSTFVVADVDRSKPTHVIHLTSEGPYFPGLPYTVK